jgi:hypothetical protein
MAYDINGTLVWKQAPSDNSGTLAWDKSLGPIAKAGLGPGTSPILFEDLLILQLDQEMGANSAIVALAKQDGRQVCAPTGRRGEAGRRRS